jgi:hypothetical protein
MKSDNFIDYVQSDGKITKKIKPLFKVVLLLLAIILIAIGAFIAFVLSSDITPKNQYTINADVCDVAKISEYNGLVSASSGYNIDNIRAFGDSVTKKDGHRDDPDCSFMLTYIYVLDNNYDKAVDYYNNYISLNSKDYFASGQISNISSSTLLKARVDSIKKDQNADSNGSGTSGPRK